MIKIFYCRYLLLCSVNLIYPSLFVLSPKKISPRAFASHPRIDYFRFTSPSNSFPGEDFFSCFYFVKEFFKKGNPLLKSSPKNFFLSLKKRKKNRDKLYFPKKKIYFLWLKKAATFLKLKF
jgi:hypothetical protein